MNTLLEVRGVQKAYGAVPALRGVDLEIPTGTLMGLVGPNGSGKTTLFSVMCGFLRADAGTVLLDGREITPTRPPPAGAMSILPQDAQFLSHFTALRQLTYYARLSGMDAGAARKDAERVLDLVGLSQQMNRPPDAMSHGQRKRVGIAQAFLGNPRLILLDEPTAGLDPHVAAEIRTMMRAIRQDQTLIVSSHDLGEIEALCSEVAILHQGRVLRHQSIHSLIGQAAEIAFRLLAAPSEGVSTELRLLPFVTGVSWTAGTSRLRITFDPKLKPSEEAGRELVTFLADRRVAFLEMQVGRSLEDRFLDETAPPR